MKMISGTVRFTTFNDLESVGGLYGGAVSVVNTRDMAEFSEKPTCQSLNTSCTLLSFDTCQGLAYHDWQGQPVVHCRSAKPSNRPAG
jgi:hypothetical protein